MAEKNVSPGLKMALELGPILIFFVGYLLLREKNFNIGGTDYSGFIVMTAIFIPVLAIATFILYRLSGAISKMQIMTLVLVVVMGGLTIWLNDARFIKMKPTLLYSAFAAILGFGLLRRQSYLQTVMSELLPMAPEGWMILTKRITAFFIALAIANELIWRNFSEATWVYFKTFGLTAALFVFFITQANVFQRYSLEDNESEKDAS